MGRILLILLMSLVPSLAVAAAPSWLDGLFPPPPPAHHRTVHPKPDVVPVPASAPVATAAAEAAPIPLPRPRPEVRPEEAAPAPVAPAAPAADAATPPPEVTPAAPPPVVSVPAEPAPAPPAATAPAGPQSTPAEGETATPKPPRIYQTACPAVITGLVEAKPLPPLSDGQCGNPSPLSVTGVLVNGRMVPLTAPATFGCEMATDLPGWVADVDNYIWSTQNTRIKAVMVGGSYECRDRNVEGGSSDLSEHGRADALDFVGFTLENGKTLTVTGDYNSADPKISRLMHFAHDAACTRFTTVLGPDANALHRDHFHLDLACHGKTCTYRLCE